MNIYLSAVSSGEEYAFYLWSLRINYLIKFTLINILNDISIMIAISFFGRLLKYIWISDHSKDLRR